MALSPPRRPEYELLKFMSGYDSARWTLDEIKRLIDSGASPADIAVVSRDTGDEIKRLEDMAEACGLPLASPAGAPFFKHPQFLAFLSFLYFAVGIDEQVSFADMLALPVFKLSASDIFRFLEGDHLRKKAPAAAVERVRKAAGKALAGVPGGNPAKIRKLYDFCGSGELAGDDIVLNRLFGKFFEYAEKFDSITADLSFEKFLALLSDSLSTFARAPYLWDSPETVKLLTVHEAKGAHFRFVFIAGALWGKFPRRFSGGVFFKSYEDEQKHYDTEEKIFRVALTGGAEKVFVTFVSGEEDDEMPSPYIEEFLGDIPARAVPSQELFSAGVEVRSAGDIAAAAKSAPLCSDAGARPRISVSALESYMKCPLKFFIERMIAPQTKKSEALICGLLVHSILEKFHAEFPEPGDGKKMLLRMDELTEEFFSPPYTDDFETLHSASCWKAFFSFFLKKYAAEADGFRVIAREKDIVVPVGDFDIRGRIDRVDDVPGGAEVIDYKTGTGDHYKQVGLRNRIAKGEHLALPVYARAVGGCSAVSLFWLADYKQPDKYPQKVTLFLGDAGLTSELAVLEKKLKGVVKSSEEGKELKKRIGKLKTAVKGVSATLDALKEMDAKMKEALKKLKKADFSPAEDCGISRNCPYKYLCDRIRGADIYES
jgi:RecB family exonuclease